MSNEETLKSFVFNSKTCRVLAHKLGCSAIPTNTDGKLIPLGEAVNASDVDDMNHPVSFCKCLKGK